MSPIVRRDDKEYRSDHRKRALAIGGVVRDDEEFGDNAWQDKGLEKGRKDPASNRLSLQEASANLDIPPSDRTGGYQDHDDSGSSDQEYNRSVDKNRRHDSLRYSVGSNATYPPRPSESLDTLADYTAKPPASTANVLRAAISLLIQSIPSLIVSLIGLIFTGQLLDHLAVWDVFVKCDELFIAVPALQNLKGNLEMCLGAKLGTAVSARSSEKSPIPIHAHFVSC